jgi:hypothetical protein
LSKLTQIGEGQRAKVDFARTLPQKLGNSVRRFRTC